MAWKRCLCSGAHDLIRNTCICKCVSFFFNFVRHIRKSKFFIRIKLITWKPISWAEETKTRRNKLECQLHLLPDIYIKIVCYYKYKIHILLHELKTRRIVGTAPLILFLDTRGGEWSASCHSRFSLWDWIPGSHQQGDTLGSSSFRKVLGKNNLLYPLGSKQGSSVFQPIA